MKKVLNGKLYDSTTAKLLGETEYSNCRDFHWFRERLYKTKSGNYFLHGEGNSASRYAEPVDQNSWSGGEKIIPITLEAAQKWAEENLSGDEYQSAFGPVEENFVQISTIIPTDLKEKMDIRKKEMGMTTSELLSSLLRDM